MALMTQLKSSSAACRRAAALVVAEGVLEDADALSGVDERVETSSCEAEGGIVADPDWAGVGVPTWLTPLTSMSSSLGRESASATTLAFP